MSETDEIQFRDLKRKDYKRLQEITATQWSLSEYSNKSLIRTLIRKHYFFSYMAITSFLSVAVYKKLPIGFYTARCNNAFSKIKNLKYSIRVSVLEALLKRSSGGRLYLRIRKEINQANKEMLQGHLFDGEGLLFIIDANFRGKGVGRRLLEELKRDAKKYGAQNLYFFTDSFCDVGYWLALGYKQLEKTTIDYFTKAGISHEFYLFSFTVY